MNIAHLKTFVAIVEAASISKAVYALHLTQPAVSLQLQNLENSLGCKLLTRSNRGVQLTEYGKVFYSYAQSFLTIWENLQHDLKTVTSGESTPLAIGTCHSIGQYALPCALYLLRQKFPFVRVAVQCLLSDEVMLELREHTIELGFVEGVPDCPDIISFPVINTELVIVAPPGDDVGALPLEDVLGLPLVLPHKDSDVRRSFQRCLVKLGIDATALVPFLELDTPEAGKSAVLSGHGYSLLPYFTVKKELYTGELKRVSVTNTTLDCTFSLAWRKASPLSGPAKEFVNFIKTEGVNSFC